MAILLIVLVLLILLDFLKNKKIFTPGILFNGIFFVTLFLYSFQLSYIQHDLLPRTVAILFLCVVGFNIPVFLCYFTKATVRLAPKREFALSDVRRRNLCLVAIVLFLIQVVYSGGVPLVWRLVGDERTYFDFGIPSFTGVYYGFIIVLGAYCLFKRGLDKYVYLAIGLLMVSRQVLISIVVEGVIFKLLTMRKLTWKFYLLLIIGVIVGILGFSALGNFRTGEDGFLSVAQFKPEYDWIPTSFKWLYSYLCFSVSNFNNLVSMSAGGVNFGSSMMSELVPTVLTDLLNIKPLYDPYFLVCPNFTVSTFLPPVYLDFGMFGCFFFCFLLGCFMQRVYRNVRVRANHENKLVYAVFAHNTLLLFFNNMFLYLPILAQFIFIPLLFKRVKKKESVGLQGKKLTVGNA